MGVIHVSTTSIVLSLLACGSLTAQANSQAMDEPAAIRAVPQMSAPPGDGDQGAPAPKDATKVNVRTGGLYAELYLPARKGPVPVLIALGGGEGGLESSSEMAVTFVSQGYGVLALAYFADPGLPPTLEGVPIEYFSRAIRWLKQRPEIDSHRIAIIGWSRGAEAALLVASRESDIRAVIAVSPSAYLWCGQNFQRPPREAWMLAGKPIPYVTPHIPPDFKPNMGIQSLLNNYLSQAKKHPEALIPVGEINGAILLICGDDDGLQPSKAMSEIIRVQLSAVHFAHTFRQLTYAGAGHVAFIGNPSAWTAESAQKFITPMLGGTLAANMRAWKDAWPATLRFLSQALNR